MNIKESQQLNYAGWGIIPKWAFSIINVVNSSDLSLETLKLCVRR